MSISIEQWNAKRETLAMFGQLVTTSGIDYLTNTVPEFRKFVSVCLTRHFIGEYGEICKEDEELNRETVRNENGCNIQSEWTYTAPHGQTKFWIITSGYGNNKRTKDPNACYTTILKPSEY